jgi:hypothetical protein
MALHVKKEQSRFLSVLDEQIQLKLGGEGMTSNPATAAAHELRTNQSSLLTNQSN